MNVGDVVADFTLSDQDGVPRSLGELTAEGPIVLFFYPGAMTSGCTAEACHFRDLSADFAAVGARPIGISADGVDRQRQFATGSALAFPLLSDPDGTVAKQFGVRRGWMKAAPTKRQTFVIGPDRRVLEVIKSEFKFERHADEALRVLANA